MLTYSYPCSTSEGAYPLTFVHYYSTTLVYFLQVVYTVSMKLPLLRYNETFVIDNEDYPLVAQYRWRLLVNRRDGYVSKYVVTTIYTEKYRPKTIYLHRLLVKCPPDKVVDHINGDTLDNRKTNLRICTTAQNNSNRHRITYMGKRWR